MQPKQQKQQRKALDDAANAADAKLELSLKDLDAKAAALGGWIS